MYPLRYDKNLLTGPFIVQTINEVTGGDAVIVTEVGQHQMWAAQYYQYRQPAPFSLREDWEPWVTAWVPL